jgi:hypothetical protein
VYHQPWQPTDISFYTGALNLVDAAVWVGISIGAAGLLVALVEGIVSRRRSLTAAVATGIPRATLARATLLQTVLSATPALLVATTAGATALVTLTTALTLPFLRASTTLTDLHTA